MPKIVTKTRQLRLKRQLELGRPIPVQEVADATGIDRAALSRIELGRTSRIDFDTLMKLCLYYGVEVGDILELDPNGRQSRNLVPAVLPG